MLLTITEVCQKCGLGGTSLIRYLGDVPLIDADALEAFLGEDEPEPETPGIYLGGDQDADR
jgi:hypothetical protein